MVTPWKGASQKFDSSEEKWWEEVCSQDLLSFRSLNQESTDAFQTACTSSLVDGRLAHIVLRKRHKAAVTDTKACWRGRRTTHAESSSVGAAGSAPATSRPPAHSYSCVHYTWVRVHYRHTWVRVQMRGSGNKHAVNPAYNLMLVWGVF